MINTIFSHSSVRKYKSDPIPDNILSEILHAAIRGSNTGNMQAYSIIVTRDAQIREQLWEQHFKQNMVKQAPVILTFCADFNRFNIHIIIDTFAHAEAFYRAYRSAT